MAVVFMVGAVAMAAEVTGNSNRFTANGNFQQIANRS
jgi:hypothetical protein